MHVAAYDVFQAPPFRSTLPQEDILPATQTGHSSCNPTPPHSGYAIRFGLVPRYTPIIMPSTETKTNAATLAPRLKSPHGARLGLRSIA